jgi:cell division septation protein DedD
MTHDIGTDDAFHEIHLSGKQLVFLFMATTVVSVVIFLLGVLVGRGVPSRPGQAQAGDPVASAPAPLPTPPPAQTAEALPATEAPPVPDEADASLSYKERLESEAATKESLSAPPPQARPIPESRQAAEPARTAARAAAPASSPAVTGSPQPGTWVVQVHALRDRAVAAGIVQRLARKGYPAFLVAAGPPTGTYKVQVGRYRDRDEAQKVIDRLKKEEQFNPWITR